MGPHDDDDDDTHEIFGWTFFLVNKRTPDYLNQNARYIRIGTDPNQAHVYSKFPVVQYAITEKGVAHDDPRREP